jgi:hypothetical protein
MFSDISYSTLSELDYQLEEREKELSRLWGMLMAGQSSPMECLQDIFKSELRKKVIETLPEAEGVCDASYHELKVGLTAVIYAIAAKNGMSTTSMLSEPLVATCAKR